MSVVPAGIKEADCQGGETEELVFEVEMARYLDEASCHALAGKNHEADRADADRQRIRR